MGVCAKLTFFTVVDDFEIEFSDFWEYYGGFKIRRKK